MSDLEIVEYSKADLERLLKNEEFWARPKLPLSRRRCIAQTLNTRATDSDILLIAAYDKGDLIAYAGILPDLLCLAGETPVKFGWITTWWMNKASEHRSAATIILFMAMKRYTGKVASSSFSADAKRIYDASRRFRECARFEVVWFVMAAPPIFGVLSTVSRWFSYAKNRVLLAFMAMPRYLQVEVVRDFDEETSVFINKWLEQDPLARDCSYWKWVLQYPWISTTDEDEFAKNRYEFSVFSKSFEQLAVVVRRHGRVIAFLVLTARERRLSLKHALYDPSDRTDVVVAMQRIIVDVNPWVFVSADEELNASIRQRVPFYLFVIKRAPILSYASFPLPLGPRPQFSIGDNIYT